MLSTGRKLAGHSENGLVPVQWNSNRATKMSHENAHGLQWPPSATRAVALWGLFPVALGCLVGSPPDSSIREGISIRTFWSASALRASLRLLGGSLNHGCGDGWVSFCHPSRGNLPNWPRRRLRGFSGQTPINDALGTTLDPTPLIWRISQRPVHTSLS